MIYNLIEKIPFTENLTSEYIENYLKNKSVKFLRWAIVDIENNNYIVNISAIK